MSFRWRNWKRFRKSALDEPSATTSGDLAKQGGGCMLAWGVEMIETCPLLDRNKYDHQGKTEFYGRRKYSVARCINSLFLTCSSSGQEIPHILFLIFRSSIFVLGIGRFGLGSGSTCRPNYYSTKHLTAGIVLQIVSETQRKLTA